MVESHRCGFPFLSSSSPVSQHYSCQPGPSGDYCYSQVGERHVYGLCNGGCYQEDGGKYWCSLGSYHHNNLQLLQQYLKKMTPWLSSARPQLVPVSSPLSGTRQPTPPAPVMAVSSPGVPWRLIVRGWWWVQSGVAVTCPPVLTK